MGECSPLQNMYPVRILDSHSFSAAFIISDRINDIQAYLSKLNSDCEKSTPVKSPMISRGDCYVAKVFDEWRRVKVCSVGFLQFHSLIFLGYLKCMN